MAVKETLEAMEGVEVESVEIGKAVISTSDFNAVEGQLKSELEEEGYPVETVRSL